MILPGRPDNLHVSPGVRTIYAKWDEVPGAAGYEVQLATDPRMNRIVHVLKTTATIAAYTNLKPDTEYFLRVRACIDSDGHLFGPFSEIVSARTIASKQEVA